MGEGRPAASQTSPGTGFRLRFAGLVALLAVVPLALASWGVVRLVSSNELNNADANLIAVVRVAQAEYASQLSGTEANARQLALTPEIQRAIVRDDQERLREFVGTHPRVRFAAGRVTIAGAYDGPAATRSARVEGTRWNVILVRPIDDSLLTKLAAVTKSFDDRLVLVYDHRVVAGSPTQESLSAPFGNPADIRFGETEYRAVAVVLPAEKPAAVVALRSREDIGAASDRTWWRALWAALVTLGTVGLLAYLVAPAVAGRRWVRRLLPRELEEQYAVESETEERHAALVPNHGAAPTQGSGGATATAVRGRHRVVIIDDDPDERTLIADTLGPDEIDVAATGDAEQGLGLLGATPADLAILDWKMSGRSGAEILAELNIRHPDVPVLVVADELEPQQRHVATLLGAEDFLIRPLESGTVVAKAKQLLGTNRPSTGR